MIKKIITAATVFLTLTCFFSSVAKEQPNPKPFVIPELREWKGSEGHFTPSAESRIVYAHDSLRTIAEAFAKDYAELFGVTLKTSEGKPSSGDFYLKAAKNKNLPSEGYTMDISKHVEASAPQAVGVYWATRSILQMLQTGNGSIPCGKVTDFPAYRFRGLSMDVARKFFPLDYLEKLAKVLSYYKMNSLRIHLNDNGFVQYFQGDWDKTYAAFRLECDTYPGLTARDGSYTKEEFRQFQKDAAKLFVDVVPEIDVPAHSLAFSHYRPDLGSEEFGMDHLNLFNPDLIPFLDKLFEEYIGGDNPVFINEYVHIGTDEFGKDYPGFDKKNETAEQFRAFMDHYIRFIESHGKKPWVWGSLSTAPGQTPVKTEGVMLDAWYNGYADPEEMIKLGFKINSIPDRYVYIVPMAGYYYDYLNTDYLYNKWSPVNVGGVDFEEGNPDIVGGYFAVWNDHVGNGVSVKDVHHRIMPALQTIATKTWDGTNVTVPYAEFDRLRHKLAEAPGVNELGLIGQPNSLVFQTASLVPGATLPFKEVGYDYTIEFDLEAVPEKPGTVLFESPNATFYLSDPVSGRLGFSRDGYLNRFAFAPYPGEKVHVEITGDNKSTTLSTNGHKESLTVETREYNGGKNKLHYLSTLVFPLEKTGDFKSKISNLKVYNYKR